MSQPRPLSRSTYQVIALVSLAAPGALTWWAGPGVYAAFGGGAMGVFGVVLVLLVAVLAWVVALLPLRRRTDLPPLTAGLAPHDGPGLAERLACERIAPETLRTAPDPRIRRRYYLRMAAGGAFVTVALGAGTAATLLESPERIYVKLLLAAIIAPVPTVYYLIRALGARPPGAD
jgi:hypothetical protein